MRVLELPDANLRTLRITIKSMSCKQLIYQQLTQELFVVFAGYIH